MFAMSLRVQLFLVVAIVALPAAGIIMFSGFQQRRAAISESYEEARKVAEGIAAEQDSLVSAAEQLLVTLAQLPDVRQRDSVRVERLLADVLRFSPQYLNIFIADPAGKMWGSAVPLNNRFSVADRRYFINAISTGRFSSGEHIIGRIFKQPTMSFGYPFKTPTREYGGVIALNFNLDYCRRMFERAKLPEGSSYILTDHRGIIIQSALNPGQYIGTPERPEIMKIMRNGAERGTFMAPGLDGVPRFFGYRKLFLPGESTSYMYVRVGIPVETVVSESTHAIIANLIVLTAFLALALAAGWIVGEHSIIGRVSALQAASRRLAAGDLDVRVATVVEGGELGELARSFDDMAMQLAAREEKQRAAEEALRRRESNYREIFNATKDALFVHEGETGRIVEVNRAAEEMFQYTAEELIQLSVQDLSFGKRPSARDEAMRLMGRASGGEPQCFEWISVRKDGSRFYSEVVLSATAIGGRGRVLAVVRDITERKHVEEDLRLKNFTIENFADCVYWVSSDGHIWEVNETACSTLGYRYSDLIGRHVSEIDNEVSSSRWEQYWEDMRVAGSKNLAAFHRRKDGSVFPVEVAANYFRYNDREYVCAIARDMTSHRQAEEEKKRLLEQLNQSQKLESIGRLAGGIAHDFNNLLTPIIGYADILRGRFREGSSEGQQMERMLLAAHKAKKLVQQLLGFGRKQILEMKALDLNQVISSFHDILRRTIREDIEIRMLLTQDHCGIRADRNQLEQIIMNLAVNAQDAISGHGTITFETAPVLIDEEYARQHPGMVPGEYVMLAVTDNGCGMDEETVKNVFEPFFTTKGHGTGLGLATVYGLVKQHGGSIWTYSEPGRGTVFKIFFPLVAEKVLEADAPARDGTRRGGKGCTVLLVEDNEMVRQLANEILLMQGFNVLLAENPLQALEIAADRMVDLLVTDVVMPHMNGPELHTRLLEVHPALPVLYMSGHTDSVIVHHGVLKEGVSFIHKPFTVHDLLQKVENVIS